MDWKNRKTYWHEAVSSAVNFPFFKEVSQNCFVFDVVLSSKIGKVSQNCFVFDVVNFKKWEGLAELLRFDVVNFKNEDVSQNCCVFDVVNLEKWRGLVE